MLVSDFGSRLGGAMHSIAIRLLPTRTTRVSLSKTLGPAVPVCCVVMTFRLSLPSPGTAAAATV